MSFSTRWAVWFWRRLAEAVDGLSAAMTAAFGRGWARVEDQLRQELGHDISADFGG